MEPFRSFSRSISRPAGVSAQTHVGDGHVETVGNGGVVDWMRDDADADEICLIVEVLMHLLLQASDLTWSIAGRQLLD